MAADLTSEAALREIEAIGRRWSTNYDRSAADYTDAGCRVLAEHAFRDVAHLLAARVAPSPDTALIEALEGLDGPIAWIAENYPAAMEAMPRGMFQAIRNAGDALAAARSPKDTGEASG